MSLSAASGPATGLGLTGRAVPVAIEVVVVRADNLNRAGVFRAVSRAPFAVVVGGVRVEAGALVAGVAVLRLLRLLRLFFLLALRLLSSLACPLGSQGLTALPRLPPGAFPSRLGALTPELRAFLAELLGSGIRLLSGHRAALVGGVLGCTGRQSDKADHREHR